MSAGTRWSRILNKARSSVGDISSAETVSPKISKGTLGNPFHILKFGHHVGVLPVGLGPHEAQYGKHTSVCLKAWIHIRTDHAGPGLLKSVFVIFVTDVSSR